LWNPVTGIIKTIDGFSKKNGATGILVKLDAFQSYFVVFYHKQKSDNKAVAISEKFPEQKTLFNLEGKWNLAFDTAWGGPASIVFDTLTDWSKRSEEGIRYYSGIALYTKSFDMPDNTEIDKNCRYFLDLGILKNLGRINLNGKDLGILWTAPLQADITDAIRKKRNHLKIEVANLWINRLIGDENQPWDGITDGKWPEWLLNGTPRNSKRYAFATYRYYKKDDPLAESGLIGPVSIKIINNLP
jgi:hypothetical protein